MNSVEIDTVFEHEDFTEGQFGQVELDNCLFQSCNFSNCDLSNTEFNDCNFENCNFSMAEIRNTTFRNVHFKHCKMMGMRFDLCKQFLLSFHFRSCQLSYSSFYKLNIKGGLFHHCKLTEADFTEADLTKANFEGCDLSGTTFEHTNLSKADFRTAINYSIDPSQNTVSKAMFSIDGVLGLLDKYDIEVS